jgi:hypothetical protein
VIEFEVKNIDNILIINQKEERKYTPSYHLYEIILHGVEKINKVFCDNKEMKTYKNPYGVQSIYTFETSIAFKTISVQ